MSDRAQSWLEQRAPSDVRAKATRADFTCPACGHSGHPVGFSFACASVLCPNFDQREADSLLAHAYGGAVLGRAPEAPTGSGARQVGPAPPLVTPTMVLPPGWLEDPRFSPGQVYQKTGRHGALEINRRNKPAQYAWYGPAQHRHGGGMGFAAFLDDAFAEAEAWDVP